MLDNHSLFDLSGISLVTQNKWTLWREELKNHPVIDDDDGTGSLLMKMNEAVDEYKRILLTEKSVSIRLSGGKDSTCLVILFALALMELKAANANINPNNVIASADTLSENPEVSRLLTVAHSQLQEFIDKNDLPVTLIRATPRLGQSLIGRIVTGRGLPSYPTKSAQCTHERKIQPVNLAVNTFFKSRGVKNSKLSSVLVLGSRLKESAKRALSVKSFNGLNRMAFSKKSGGFEFYPIAEWSISDVWNLLNLAGTDKPIPAYAVDFNQLSTFYAEATGECVYNAREESELSEGCSARSGCFDCVRVSEDKSMQELLNNPHYSYMKPLNNIRNFLWNIQYDWSKRNLLGRTATNGFAKLRPDVFDYKTCYQILAAMITADFHELERAKTIAKQISTNKIEPTQLNLRLSKPQFCHVSVQDIMFVEFLWSLHTFNVRPFLAIELYTKIWSGDREYFEMLDGEDIPQQLVPKTPYPQTKYIYVGDKRKNAVDEMFPNDWSTHEGHDCYGLRDVMSEFYEQSNTKTLVNKKGDIDFMIDADFDSFLDVDFYKAQSFIDNAWIHLDQDFTLRLPQTSALKLLSLGIIKLGQSKEYLYQQMCRRAQKYHALRLYGGLSWSNIEDLTSRTDLQILTEFELKAHKQRLIQLYARWNVWMLVVELNKTLITNMLEKEAYDRQCSKILSLIDDTISARMCTALYRMKKEVRLAKRMKRRANRLLACAIDELIDFPNLSINQYFLDKSKTYLTGSGLEPNKYIADEYCCLAKQHHLQRYLIQMENKINSKRIVKMDYQDNPSTTNLKVYINHDKTRLNQLALF